MNEGYMIERADTARRRLVDDVRAMSQATGGSRWALPTLLGIAAVAVVATGAAVLVSRARRKHRRRWVAPETPSLFRQVARTVALNAVGALAARLAQAVPVALLAARAESRGPG